MGRIATDFVGSDVLYRYTAAYSWQANQLGHVGLGVVATFLVWWVAGQLTAWAIGAPELCLWEVAPAACRFRAADLPFAAIALAWLAYVGKEAVDYGLATKLEVEGSFAISRRELLADSIADCSFVTLGVLLAAAAVTEPYCLIYILVGGCALWLAFARRVLPGKRAFDRSDLPFYYRLPVFAQRITVRNREMIERFMREEEGPRHLLLVGGPGTGKTTLAVGIGSTLAAAYRKRVRYMSFFKMVEEKNSSEQLASLDESLPYSPYEADWLIIDDVSLPTAKGPRVVDLSQLGKNWKELFLTRRSVWTLSFDDPGQADKWTKSLKVAFGDAAVGLVPLSPAAGALQSIREAPARTIEKANAGRSKRRAKTSGADGSNVKASGQ